MQTTRGQRQAERLRAAVAAFVEQIQRVPPELLARPPKPGEWSLLELAAHSAEIYPYWAKQIVWLRQHAGQPFGRTASDPERIKFVEEHRSEPLDQLVGAIQRGSEEAARALSSYSDSEWETVTGIHAARGEMHMDGIADLFLAGHAEEHLRQLRETLAELQS
ncbi:MAG TPA: DinB family protein [Chloroflexota bacterium]|nr:DinB family protein [Chloroflexota bacterium]